MIRSVEKKQFTTIETDWFGRAGHDPAFCLDQDGDGWLFQVRVPGKPVVHPGATPGASQEGLWRYDVAEWFVASQYSGRYIECNLAPNGAWWMMLFDKPRQRAASMPDAAGVRTRGLVADGGWEAHLRMPASLLAEALGAGVLTHNVCFILGLPRRHYSWAKSPGAEPDFHQPQHFSLLSE